MRRVRHIVFRCFQGEDQQEKMPLASLMNLARGPITARRHPSTSHKIAQDLFRAGPFLIVLCFRNRSSLAAQLKAE